MKTEDITLIDLCYRYGASPAAQALVPVPLLSTKKFDPRWIESGQPCNDLIELMRYQQAAISEIGHEPSPSEFWLWHDRLKFYSLLMLAQFTQAVPNSLPEAFLVSAKRELADYPPGRYAESGFPLVGAFLLKLEGQYNETAHTRASDVFHRLLALDSSVRTDPSMLKASWLASRPGLIDSSRVSDGLILRLANMMEKLRAGVPVKEWGIYDPQVRVGRQIFEKIGATEEDHVSIVLLDTLWSVVRFCNDLHELLSGIEDRMVAGLVRHYYAHILDAFYDQRRSPLKDNVRQVLDLFSTFVDNEGPDKDDVTGEKQSHGGNKWLDALLAVTNREQWHLPSNLESLLTDTQSQAQPIPVPV